MCFIHVRNILSYVKVFRASFALFEVILNVRRIRTKREIKIQLSKSLLSRVPVNLSPPKTIGLSPPGQTLILDQCYDLAVSREITVR